MTFTREFPVGRFNLGLRSSGLNAQNSVVVDHCASANSLKPAMDAKSCLRTPRHSPKNYSTSRKYFGPLSCSGRVLISFLSTLSGLRITMILVFVVFSLRVAGERGTSI